MADERDRCACEVVNEVGEKFREDFSHSYHYGATRGSLCNS